MKYNDLPVGYKHERITTMMHHLDNGGAVEIRHMYLDEIKILKAIYGKELKKEDGILYHKPEVEE